MLEIRTGHYPTIIYRPMRPSDLEALELMHTALFPIRYEREFFLNVVNGHGIVSWAAVAINQPDGQTDELIGFVTARTIAAKDSEIDDLLRYDISRKDPILLYILTLGVIERYRNLGIATSLIQEVIKHASSITNCRAVYLHVIAYNHPAIHFYKKMSFKLVRRLHKFYYINGQNYDSYLFVYYVNGGRSPCSPLLEGRTYNLPSQTILKERRCNSSDNFYSFNYPYKRHTVAAVASYFMNLLKSLSAKLWKNDEKKISRWSKCKETNSLVDAHNARILSSKVNLCQTV